MRGTPAQQQRQYGANRIIPAHAGNSVLRPASPRLRPDHPRACGELRFVLCCACDGGGSSPRMRGTLGLQHLNIEINRIIPAHAGNSSRLTRRRRQTPDHPRACGELLHNSSGSTEPTGSSPRMRGTQCFVQQARACARIIPAHAGNSVSCCAARAMAADHPRACGELLARARSICLGIGSSPRMRGTHVHPSVTPGVLRIIPAHAGNSAEESGSARACRIIPAHAGNSGSRHLFACGSSDHPRACGELRLIVTTGHLNGGSSPRMRGTRHRHRHACSA